MRGWSNRLDREGTTYSLSSLEVLAFKARMSWFIQCGWSPMTHAERICSSLKECLTLEEALEWGKLTWPNHSKGEHFIIETYEDRRCTGRVVYRKEEEEHAGG